MGLKEPIGQNRIMVDIDKIDRNFIETLFFTKQMRSDIFRDIYNIPSRKNIVESLLTVEFIKRCCDKKVLNDQLIDEIGSYKFGDTVLTEYENYVWRSRGKGFTNETLTIDTTDEKGEHIEVTRGEGISINNIKENAYKLEERETTQFEKDNLKTLIV